MVSIIGFAVFTVVGLDQGFFQGKVIKTRIYGMSPGLDRMLFCVPASFLLMFMSAWMGVLAGRISFWVSLLCWIPFSLGVLMSVLSIFWWLKDGL